MTNATSSRAILRSSSIIGGASVISILIGLLKFKLVALYLGPAGIGIIGLMLNIVSIAASIGGLGLATAATRQVAAAAATNDEAALAVVRRAVVLAGIGLAVLTAIVMLALHVPVTRLVGQDMSRGDTAWLALATAMTIAAGAQTALLNGLRRIGDLARITVLGAVLGTAAGLVAIATMGAGGIPAFIVAAPLSTLILGQVYVARLPRHQPSPIGMGTLWAQWRVLAWVGFGLMGTSLASSGGQLFLRSYLQAHAGSAELGYFQAAWMISMNYLSFVLTAMATDFYPRLTAVIKDRDVANRMVNEQAEIVLLLVGPLMIGMVAFSPLIVDVLYSNRFAPAASILRLQTIGDLLKVMSWPLGIIILAAGQSITVFLLEALAMTILAGVSVVLLPVVGVQATGFAFIAMYAVYLPVTWWRANRVTGMMFSRAVVLRCAVLLMLMVLVAAIADSHPYLAMGLGAILSIIVGFVSLNRLAHMSDLPTPVLKLRSLLFNRLRRVDDERMEGSI